MIAAADMPSSAFLTGLVLSASLIMAIGAQNAFVLRQGLKREYVPQVVAFCVSADVVLLTVGVAGLGRVLVEMPVMNGILTLGGSAFLVGYGVRSLSSAITPRALEVSRHEASLSLRTAMTQLAAFTFLNPHVYLDTVLLLGSVGARQPDEYRPWFLAGALLASAGWFSALGFGARLLTPWFAHPRAWRALDFAIGVMMLGLGTLLGVRALAG